MHTLHKIIIGPALFILSSFWLEPILQFRKHMVNITAAAAAAKSPQSCPTLCDHTDGIPPGSSIHGIFQARVLEWVAIAFSETLLSLYQKNKS